MRYAIYTILGLITLGMISTAVLSQEVYRPVALAQVEGEDTGFWCLTREEINSFSKLAGINWMAEPHSMTLVKGDGGKVVIEFTGLCATSAKVVQ
jgi:hypothetical protein